MTSTTVATSASPATAVWRQTWRSALALGIAAAGLWTATHGVAGTSWVDVGTVLLGLPRHVLGQIALVWFGGLAVYATVLAGALPGLGVRRGLLLNLSGSAVANLMPLGGAVATGLNWRMVRGWGHSDGAFAAFCVLTNVLDVASKLVLPLVAVGTLAVVSVHVPTVLWTVAGVCVALLLLGGGVELALGRVHTSSGHHARAVLERVATTWDGARSVLTTRWARLLPGSIGYVAAQVLLLALCLHAVGLSAPVSVVLMAAAIERLTSLIPITPGGVGFAEVTTIAWLAACGLDPTSVVAGVLLYRVFLVVMEIPVGGVLLGGWAWRRFMSTGASA